jgi:hypothetical protein
MPIFKHPIIVIQKILNKHKQSSYRNKTLKDEKMNEQEI